jgi:hypothetical protein
MTDWKVKRPSFTLLLDGSVVEIVTPTLRTCFSGDEILRLHDALGWVIDKLLQLNGGMQRPKSSG